MDESTLQIAEAQAAKDAELMAKLETLKAGGNRTGKVFSAPRFPNRAERRQPKAPNKARYTEALTDKQRARISREARVLAGLAR